MSELRVSRFIPAPAEQVWQMVSDVTRMGEWSPEASGGTWTKGATGPTRGATFVGTNERGDKRWSTTCTVVDCEPGQSFAFEVTGGPFKVARWAYGFAPEGEGCRVTETWTDRRGRLVKALGRLMTGVSDRQAHNEANMVATLEALERAATT